ncbi:uncharacterized protein [Panulirus ornatus]|uniref:uncharacterized protein n=1 Tax=Panulirus ornatus TaxID=150431 RepID=UPI003A89741A
MGTAVCLVSRGSWLRRLLLVRNDGFQQAVSYYKMSHWWQSTALPTREVIDKMLFTSTGDNTRGRHLKLFHSDSDAVNEIVSNISSNRDEKTKIGKTFDVLKMKLERLGHLNAKDIERAVECLDHHVGDLTESDCMKLLHFTLRMAEDEYRPCADLVQHVWLLSTKSNAHLTCEHFELYLQTCLLAESSCTFEDIFSRLEHHQLEPSKRVLESLMLLLGHHGDVAGATNTLNIMKQWNIPVSETILSALIMAHGISK